MITKSGYGTSKTNNVSSEKTQRYKKLLEEPQVQPVVSYDDPYNFEPEDAINLKSGLNATLKRINNRGLSQERIEEIKETSPILNPEKYHKDVDAGYYGRKAAEGFARAGEGIVDAATILGEHLQYPQLKATEFVTSLGGLAKNPVSNLFTERLAQNKEAALKAVQETPVDNYAKMTDFIYNDVGKGHKLAGDVVSGVTAMAPTIATNLLLPGAGYAVLGAQAFGGGTQQAYQHTGELGAKEEIYGLLSGLAEVAVEKVSGGIGGLGNGMVDDIASKMIRNGFIRSATGEGIEEAVTTFIDPYLERLTYNKEAEGGITSAETWKEAVRSALIGTLTSMVLQGGSAAVNTAQTSINTDKDVKKLKKLDNTTLNQLSEIDKNIQQGNVLPRATETQIQQPKQETTTDTELKLPTTKTNSVYQASKGNVDVKIANRLMDIAERTNARVEGFYDENPNIEGNYKDGVIRINVNSEKAADTIFAHEFTHHLESTNAWEDVRDAIINSNTLYNMLSEKGINIDEYKQQIKETYAKIKTKENPDGIILDDAGVEKEIVAKFVESKLMKDEKTIVRMINENPSFMQRLKNFWDDLVVRFKGTAEEKELRRIQNIYNKAFAEAQKGNTKSDSNKTQFSLKTAIEEVKDLIAMHNLSAENLRNALNLGGLPVPSIAITKAENEYGDFGNITLVFGKDTIDPKNYENEVYDRDIYSKTIPPLRQKITPTKLRKLKDKFEPFYKEVNESMYSKRESELKETNVEDLANYLSYDAGMKLAYLRETGEDFDFVNSPKKWKSGLDEEELKKFIDNHPEVNNYQNAYAIESGELWGYEKELQDLYMEHSLKGITDPKYIQFIKRHPKEIGLGTLQNFMYDVIQYKNGDYGKTEKDIYATKDKLKELVPNNDSKFINWIKEQINPYYGAKYYDADGEKIALDLHSLTEYMKRDSTRAKQKTTVYSLANAAAQGSNQLESIKEIKEYSEKIKDFETVKEAREALEELDVSVRDDITIQRLNNGESFFDVYKDYYKAIGEYLANKADLQTAFKHNYFSKLTPQQMDKLEYLAKQIEATPVKYFEVKPQRAVGFDEVAAIVMPKDTDSSLKEEIRDKGIEIVEYDSNIEGDRLRAVNSIKDIQFSVKTDSIETDKQKSTPKREKVVDKIAPQTDIEIENLPNETEKVARILTKAPKKQQDFSFETVKDVLMRKILDTGNTINTIGKIAKDDVLYPMYNNTKQARQSAEYMIGEKQTDITGTRIVGNSLIEVFEPVKRKGEEYTGKFYEYLLHMHNIDRMAQDKPVFGKSVTAEDSKRIAGQLLKENPEFERLANRVYVYNRNLMQWRVDSGLVSQEQADEMNRIYPHYVPTFRDMSGIAGAKVIGNSINISQTLKKATGSDRDILPIDLSMARQTMQTVQAAKRNLLGNRLLNDVLANKDQVGKYITKIEKSDDSLDIDEQSDAALSSDKNNNIFKIYRDGKSVNMYVNNGIFEGLKAISSQTDNTDTSKLLSALSKPNTMFKQLVTGFNPMFMLKNPIRDVQDATLYSKNLREFAKKYPQTFKEMVNNSKDWQLYKSLGGTGSTFFDYETGIENELNKGKLTRAKEATLGRIEYLNMITEQAPRFAEFKATLEKAGNRDYDTLLKAVYNAADVTVNFGRSGSITQILNKTAVPFLNPSIQGASKTIRTIVTTKGGTEWAKLVTKFALFGILPSVLNELLYWDDEDYEKLNDRDKDVNFVLKYGDNQWIKIPKGRVISFLGNLANRGIRTARGQEVNWGDFLATTLDQTAPISPFESNIVSPIKAVKDNKTWYGSDIVPQRLQQYEPRDQYDEKTDAFSKWLGGILNYSPKKINYLIDAYTGVIGDFALPLTTPTAETNPFVKAFTIDGTFSNEIGNKFYETKDKYNKYKNDTPTATVVTRYLNKQNEMASDLHAEIRKIQSSDISDKEKKAKASELRELINLIQANAVLYAEEYEQVVNKYINKFPKNPDRSADYAYLMANYELFGPEYAVKTYNLSTYNKNKHKNMQTVFNQIKNNFNTTKPVSAQKTETLPTAKDIPTKR